MGHHSFGTFSVPLVAFMAILAMSGCRPEGLDTTWSTHYTGLDGDLFHLTMDSTGHGFGAGGRTWYSGGILESTDHGQTWNLVANETKALLDIDLSVEGWISMTGVDGHVWERPPDGSLQFSQPSEWRLNRAVVRLENGDLLLGGGQSFQFGHLFRLDPQGGIHDLTLPPNLVNDVALCRNGRMIAAAYGAVLVSEDQGAHWDFLDITGDHYMAIGMSDPDHGFMVGYGGSILRTADGWVSWDVLRNGDALTTTDTPFRSLAVSGPETAALVGDNGTVWVTRDRGDHWQRLLGLSRALDLTAAVITGDTLLVGGTGGRIYSALLPEG